MSQGALQSSVPGHYLEHIWLLCIAMKVPLITSIDATKSEK